jgi:hypothetical protein
VRAFLGDEHRAFGEAIGTFAGTLRARRAPDDDAAARHEARELLAALGGGGWLDPIARVTGVRAASRARRSPRHRRSRTRCSRCRRSAPRRSCSRIRRCASAGSARDRRPRDGRVRDDRARRRLGPVGDRDDRADSTGAHYVLNGAKTLISNAGIADFYVVFASTNPTRAGRACRRSSCRPIRRGCVSSARSCCRRRIRSARSSSPTAACPCRTGWARRARASGSGSRRSTACAPRWAPPRAAWPRVHSTKALAHARARRQFGKPLAEFQLVQEKLARMATELVAARLLVYRAAWEADQGADRVTLEAAMAKSWATEAAQRIVDDAVQILGGAGVLASHPVDRLYRSVRALRIYEGATEIQHLVIAGQLLAAAATPSEGARA